MRRVTKLTSLCPRGRTYLRSTMAASSLLAACAVLAFLTPSTAFVPSSRGSQHAMAASAKSLLFASSGAADDTAKPVSLSPPSSQASRREILSKATSSALGLSSALVVLGPDSAGAFQPGPVTAQSAANKAAYEKSYQGVWADRECLIMRVSLARCSDFSFALTRILKLISESS